ncbi:hypothetical protein BH09GEM1_BH09GEM1_39670 [soil metagenome]
MTVSRVLRSTSCAVLLLAAGAGAQVVPERTSPIDDLLRQSQNAFNDLQYLKADSFATQVLALQRISGAQRIRALLIRAAAYFPEEVSAQKRPLALAALKEVVRSNIDATMPQDLTWPGLDSLLVEAKRSTFGAAIAADPEQTAIGPNGMGELRVRANRPAIFRLVITPAGSEDRVATGTTDSVTSGVIRFPTMRDSKPIFTTGDYDITMIATDLSGADTSLVRTTARITAPELKYDPVPMIIDSSRFVKERTGAFGWRGIFVGALASGGVYGLSNVLRGDQSIKDKVPADSKGIAAAAAVGVAVLAASFLDPGQPMQSAIATNQRVRDDFAKSIRDTQATNANRLATYRVTIAIQSGTR